MADLATTYRVSTSSEGLHCPYSLRLSLDPSIVHEDVRLSPTVCNRYTRAPHPPRRPKPRHVLGARKFGAAGALGIHCFQAAEGQGAFLRPDRESGVFVA